MDHMTHHELDHYYDDQHDIEPVHYHEHAILKAMPYHEDVNDEELYLSQVPDDVVIEKPVVHGATKAQPKAVKAPHLTDQPKVVHT